MGCDYGMFHRQSLLRNFNPRTHRGVRPRCKGKHHKTYTDFNPRTHRGVRLSLVRKKKKTRKFQSTHPSWGATEVLRYIGRITLISIHAPIVGCDSILEFLYIFCTHISIHAPIVGCDISLLMPK